MKTPTAAAEYLIAQMVAAADQLAALVNTLVQSVSARMYLEESRLAQIATRLPSLLGLVNTRQLHRVEQLEYRLSAALLRSLAEQSHRLQLIEKIVSSASPQLILQRGYTLTRCDGKVVRDASMLTKGSVLTTQFADGETQSVVQ